MKKTRSLTAVIGAKGGIGASCLAAAIAHGAQQTEGRGALLDLDTAGGGLEVLLGIEGEPGARWPEMLAAFGEVDGGGLLAALPRWGAVPVLSAARQAPQLPPDELVLDICAGLLRNDETVVLDVPRPAAWTPAIKALLADANIIYLLVQTSLPAAAGALAVAAAVSELSTRRRGPRCELVVQGAKGSNTHKTEIAELVGWPVAGFYRPERDLSTRIEVGAGPIGLSSGRYRRSKLAKVGLELAQRMAV